MLLDGFMSVMTERFAEPDAFYEPGHHALCRDVPHVSVRPFAW